MFSKLSSTVSNLSRTADKYGDVHFISFLGSILSRLAYMNDNKFLTQYMAIMGPIIVPKIMMGINSVPSTNLSMLLDDQQIFGLDKSPNDILIDDKFVNYIDWTAAGGRAYQYKNWPDCKLWLEQTLA